MLMKAEVGRLKVLKDTRWVLQVQESELQLAFQLLEHEIEFVSG